MLKRFSFPMSLVIVASLLLLFALIPMVALVPAPVQAGEVNIQTWGNVTFNGVPAPLGTKIEVFVGTEKSGTETTNRSVGE